MKSTLNPHFACEHKGYCWIIVRCNKLTWGSSGSWLVPLMEMHPFCPKICNSPISSDSICTRKHKARLRHKVDCRNRCTKWIFMEQNFKIEYALVLHCWPWNEQFPIDQALDWSNWSAFVDNFYNNYLKPLSAYKKWNQGTQKYYFSHIYEQKPFLYNFLEVIFIVQLF